MKLKNGRIGEIIVVARGIDALRPKTELQILELGPSMMAALGSDWMNLYYEATIELPSMELLVVNPRDVSEVLPPLD